VLVLILIDELVQGPVAVVDGVLPVVHEGLLPSANAFFDQVGELRDLALVDVLETHEVFQVQAVLLSLLVLLELLELLLQLQEVPKQLLE